MIVAVNILTIQQPSYGRLSIILIVELDEDKANGVPSRPSFHYSAILGENLLQLSLIRIRAFK